MTTETNADLIGQAINELETSTLLYFNTGIDRMFDRVTGAKEAIKGIVECQQEEIDRLRELVKVLKLHAVHCDSDGRGIQPYEIIDVINEFMAGETNG